MKKLRTLFVIALVSLMGLAIVTEDTFARGSRSSRSRSYSKPKAAPVRRATPARKATPAKVAPKPAPVKSWSGTKKTTTTTTRKTAKAPMTSAQQKSLETAKKNGTSFTSKTAATDAFKTKHASTYTSKYPTKPAARPTHIPETTMVNGKSTPVVYNAERGSYGYGVGSAFSPYNSMSDLVMLSILMDRNHYVVQPMAPVVASPVVRTAPVVVQKKSNFGTIMFCTVAGIIFVAICIGVASNRKD